MLYYKAPVGTYMKLMYAARGILEAQKLFDPLPCKPRVHRRV